MRGTKSPWRKSPSGRNREKGRGQDFRKKGGRERKKLYLLLLLLRGRLNSFSYANTKPVERRASRATSLIYHRASKSALGRSQAASEREPRERPQRVRILTHASFPGLGPDFFARAIKIDKHDSEVRRSELAEGTFETKLHVVCHTKGKRQREREKRLLLFCCEDGTGEDRTLSDRTPAKVFSPMCISE